IFFIVRVAPGDPATAVLGDYASKEAVDALRKRMGLDRPLWEQYIDFLGGLLHGDFGRSLITGQPTLQQIRQVFPYTLELAVAAILVALALGVPLGVITAVRRNTGIDYVGRIVSLAGLSMPAFYLGVLLILLFAVHLRLFPAIGAAPFSQPRENLHALVLPAVTLGLIEAAYITRLTRSAVLNVLHEDYVRTARSKGLPERRVLFGHALRSALIPLVSLLGLTAISLVGGTVLTEEVFARPGLGKLMIGATKQRDYTLLQSLMVIYALLIVVVNLVVDLLYGLFDPRIRYR
ncbi:MAG: ABC transporter permease, partial [Thermomicrobiaceae bacterium]|nr:ABC transporter permease [Thermomicrobiaceae bacterium]